MDCALSVFLLFACLAKRVSTKTGITEKGKSYTINFNYYLLNNNDSARIAPIYFFNATLPSIIYYTT